MITNKVTITYQDRRTLKESSISYTEDRQNFDADKAEGDARLIAVMFRPKYNKILRILVSVEAPMEITQFSGCRMCGNEWKSINDEGFCSSCWSVWKS